MAIINIRDLKIAAVQTLISSAAMSGLIALTLGTTSCFVGLSSTAIIKFGELLTPHRNSLKVIMFYGSASVGAGLFSIGIGMAVTKLILEPMEIEELRSDIYSSSSTEIKDKFIRSVCVGCVNFHGRSYNGVQLVCAIYPSGWTESDQCPAWEHKPND